MFVTLFLTLSLAFQHPIALPDESSLDGLERIVEQQTAQAALERAEDYQHESFREHRFETKFNDVAKALADFGDSFNRNQEIDEGKVERLKKAWRNLVKTDSWFNTSADQQADGHQATIKSHLQTR